MTVRVCNSIKTLASVPAPLASPVTNVTSQGDFLAMFRTATAAAEADATGSRSASSGSPPPAAPPLLPLVPACSLAIAVAVVTAPGVRMRSSLPSSLPLASQRSQGNVQALPRVAHSISTRSRCQSGPKPLLSCQILSLCSSPNATHRTSNTSSWPRSNLSRCVLLLASGTAPLSPFSP